MKACFCEFLSKKKTNYVDHGIIYKMKSGKGNKCGNRFLKHGILKYLTYINLTLTLDKKKRRFNKNTLPTLWGEKARFLIFFIYS